MKKQKFSNAGLGLPPKKERTASGGMLDTKRTTVVQVTPSSLGGGGFGGSGVDSEALKQEVEDRILGDAELRAMIELETQQRIIADADLDARIVDGLADAVADLQQKIDDMGTGFGNALEEGLGEANANLGTAVDGLNGRIDGVATEVGDTKTYIQTLESEYDGKFASINEQWTTTANEVEAHAQWLLELEAEFGENNASVTQRLDALADANSAMASQFLSLEATVNDNRAYYEEQITALASADQAMVTKHEELVATVADNKASAESLIQVVATDTEAVATRVDSLTVSVGDNAAAIIAESTARADADQTMTETIETHISTYNDNKAVVQQQINTLTDADTAIASSVTTLRTDMDGNVATINDSLTALSTEDQALSQRITDLGASVGGSNAEIEQTLQALAEKDLALAASITDLTATVDGNKATAHDELQVVVDSVSAEAQRITTLRTDFEDNIAVVDQRFTAASDATSAVATSVLSLEAVVDDNRAAADQQIQVLTDDLQAEATKTDTLRTEFDDNVAQVQQQFVAQSTATSAVATSVETLTTTVQGNKAEAETAIEAVSTDVSALVTRTDTIEARTYIGANLIPNANLNNNAQGWLSVGSNGLIPLVEDPKVEIVNDKWGVYARETSSNSSMQLIGPPLALTYQDFAGQNFVAHCDFDLNVDTSTPVLGSTLNASIFLISAEPFAALPLHFGGTPIPSNTGFSINDSERFKLFVNLQPSDLESTLTQYNDFKSQYPNSNLHCLWDVNPRASGIRTALRRFKLEVGVSPTTWTNEGLGTQVNARISTEELARTTADEALASRTLTLETGIGDLGSDLIELQQSVTTNQTTTATKLTELESRGRINPNLLYNGGFENGMDGWSSSTYWEVTDDPYRGRICKVKDQYLTATGSLIITQTVLGVKEGQTYTYSFDGLVQGAQGTVGANVIFKNDAGTTLSQTTQFTYNASDPEFDYTKRYAKARTFTTPAGCTKMDVRIFKTGSVNALTLMAVRRLKLEEGSVATPYTSDNTLVNISAKYTSQQQSIVNLETGKASVTDVTTLQARVGTVEGSMTTANSAIADIQTNKATVTSVTDLRAQVTGGSTSNDINVVTGLLGQLRTVVADGDSALAEQITSLSAGVGEQFNSLINWNFVDSLENWTPVGGTLAKTSVGFTITATNANNGVASPTTLEISGKEFFYIRCRVRRLAGTAWEGGAYFVNAGHGVNTTYRKIIDEPDWTPGWVTITWDMSDLTTGGTNWIDGGPISQIRLDLGNAIGDKFEFDWIAVGNPSPGASLAQLTAIEKAAADANTALASRVTTLEADVNTAVTGIKARLEVTEEALSDSVEGSVARRLLDLEADYGTNKAQVSSTLEAMSDDISSNATLATSANTKVDQNIADLQNLEELESTHYAATVSRSNLIESRTSTNPNILINGGFEEGMEGWNSSGFFDWVDDQVLGPYIKLKDSYLSASSSQVMWLELEDLIAPGTTLTFSFDYFNRYVQGASPQTGTPNGDLLFYNNNTQLSGSGAAINPSVLTNEQFDERRRFSTSFITAVVPANCNKVRVRLYKIGTGQNLLGMGFRRLKLEASSVPTAFTFDGALRTLNSSIKTVEQTSTTAIQALATRTDTLESTIVNPTTGLASAHTKISTETTARTTADTALGTRIDSVETSVGTANTRITTEITNRTTADTALGSRIDNVETSVSGNTSRIANEETARANADSALATSVTQLNSKTNVGPNLLPNGGFENGLDGWNGPFEIINHPIHGPYASPVGTALTDTTTRQLVSNLYPAVGGQTYTLSCDMFLEGASAGTCDILLRALNNGTWISSQTIAINNTSKRSFSVDDSWRYGLNQGNVQFTLPATANQFNIYFRKLNTVRGAEALGVRRIKVEPGPIPTPYTAESTLVSTNASIKTLESTLTDANGALATRVSNVETSTGNNSTRITNEESARTTADAALSTRASTLEARTVVNPNLIPNGGFEDGMTGWFGAYWEAVDSPVWGRYIRLLPNRLNTTGSLVSYRRIDGLVPGTVMTFSGDFMNFHDPISGRSGYAGASIYFYTADGTAISNHSAPGSFNNTEFSEERRLTSSKVTVTVPANTGYALIRFYRNGSGSNIVELGIRRLKLEIGSEPTVWSSDSSLSGAYATIKDTASSLTTDITAVSTRTSSIESSLSNSSTGLGAAHTKISSEETARINADNALGTRIDTVTATANRKINYRQPTTPVGAKEGDLWINTASGKDLEQKYFDGSAWQLVTDPRISQNTSAITAESTARANAISAEATARQTLETTVNGHTSSISTQATSIDGLRAQYTVKVTTGGYVSGYGLASTVNNGVPSSTFKILADKFVIGSPTMPDKAPFVITTDRGTARVAIDGDLIVNGSLQGPAIADYAVKVNHLAAGAVTASKILATDTSNILIDAALTDDNSWTMNKLPSASENTWSINRGGSTYSSGNYLFVKTDALSSQSGTNWLGGAVSTRVPVEGNKPYTFGARITMETAGTNRQVVIYLEARNRAGSIVQSTPLGPFEPTIVNGFRTMTVTVPTTTNTVEIRVQAQTKTTGSSSTGWITVTDLFVRRSANAELIPDGTIQANHLVADSVTASKIVVGDWSNLVPDPLFNDFANSWTVYNNVPLRDGYGSLDKYKNMLNLTANSTPSNSTISGSATSRPIPIEPGKPYWVEGTVYLGSDNTARGSYVEICIFYYKKDSTTSYTSAVVASRTAAGTSTIGSLVNAPDDAYSVAIQFRGRAASAGALTGTIHAMVPVIRRATSGELVVDGSIKANHLDADSVTAGAIKAGAVTADKVNVSQLSAINSNMGIIRAGIISMENPYDSQGWTYIRSGSDKWWGDGVNGFFLGKNTTENSSWSDLQAGHSYLRMAKNAQGVSSGVINLSNGTTGFYADSNGNANNVRISSQNALGRFSLDAGSSTEVSFHSGDNIYVGENSGGILWASQVGNAEACNAIVLFTFGRTTDVQNIENAGIWPDQPSGGTRGDCLLNVGGQTLARTWGGSRTYFSMSRQLWIPAWTDVTVTGNVSVGSTVLSVRVSVICCYR